ncbi:MAG: nucleotidyltransferase family protein [Chloroflexi bacterium]|nr:nucleotidyltransferase family protein [Chloroflexota bacterium]
MPLLSLALKPDIRVQLVKIAEAHHISYLAIFGSFARGTAVSTSDIDIAVRFAQPIDLLEFVGIQLEMEELLGRPVDLIPVDDAYPFVRESMARDLTVLYEAPSHVDQQ